MRYFWMIKKKCDRCGSSLGTDSKKTKQRFCGKCKRKFELDWDVSYGLSIHNIVITRNSN